jgi:hypothetical protein
LKFILTIIFVLSAHSALACSAFLMTRGDRVRIGKSYDWFRGLGHGAVYTNRQGVWNEAINIDGSPRPARWQAQFGSVTFSQFGKGFPIGGMNERGLVVEMLQLDDSGYAPITGERPFINESQWTQYQLDNFASTAEVLVHLAEMTVSKIYIGIHYFVADSFGNAAVVEFLDGKAVVHTGAELPVAGLTNSPYDTLLAFYLAHQSMAVPQPMFLPNSRQRFTILADELQTFHDGDHMPTTAAALNILRSVQMGGLGGVFEPSQWNIVYDPIRLKVTFRSKKSPAIKTLAMDQIDFSGTAREKMADINTPSAGPVVSQLIDFNSDLNRKMINKNSVIIGPTKRKIAAAYGDRP